jgi:hypothetical protein
VRNMARVQAFLDGGGEFGLEKHLINGIRMHNLGSVSAEQVEELIASAKKDSIQYHIEMSVDDDGKVRYSAYFLPIGASVEAVARIILLACGKLPLMTAQRLIRVGLVEESELHGAVEQALIDTLHNVEKERQEAINGLLQIAPINVDRVRALSNKLETVLRVEDWEKICRASQDSQGVRSAFIFGATVLETLSEQMEELKQYSFSKFTKSERTKIETSSDSDAELP